MPFWNTKLPNALPILGPICCCCCGDSAEEKDAVKTFQDLQKSNIADKDRLTNIIIWNNLPKPKRDKDDKMKGLHLMYQGTNY